MPIERSPGRIRNTVDMVPMKTSPGIPRLKEVVATTDMLAINRTDFFLKLRNLCVAGSRSFLIALVITEYLY